MPSPKIQKGRARRTNPKRTPDGVKRSRTNWYTYYAGYSPEFVSNTLDELDLPPGATVLDPWNGSGTTTQLARDKGYSPVGFDINPAMVVIAKARLLRCDVKESLASLCIDIVEKAHRPTTFAVDEREPLRRWLSPSTASAFRQLERAIDKLLINHPAAAPLARCVSFDHLSSLAAFFYTALFRATRRSVRKFQASNPTWIKPPSSPNARVKLDDALVFDSFKSSCLEMIADMLHDQSDHIDALCKVDLASSTSVPLRDNEAHAVISSPPYCTRIDYAVATWPELAIMGASNDDVDLLRRRMIGTTTVPKAETNERTSWGHNCISTIRRVSTHPSKASATYYRRNLTQYFEGLDLSLGELARVIRPKGHLVLVVQDSFYKDVHIDLPRIVEQMADSHGFSRRGRQNFRVSQTLAGINPRSLRYRPTASAVEAVLRFSKD